MRHAGRLALLAFGLAGLTVAFAAAYGRLPNVGDYHGVYGETLNRVATPERQITDVVTAVNFDYRAVDTMGEEMILFTSVIGVVLLLRKHEGEHEEKGGDDDEGEQPTRDAPKTSNAVRLLGVALVAPTLLFALYVASHGQVTPGGGFQGGVIAATAPLLAYLAGGAEVFAKIAPKKLVEVGEAIGAGGIVALGMLGVVTGGAFLQNVLPQGHWGSVTSAGLVPLLNLGTALEVAGGTTFVLAAFVAETRKQGGNKKRARGGSS